MATGLTLKRIAIFMQCTWSPPPPHCCAKFPKNISLATTMLHDWYIFNIQIQMNCQAFYICTHQPYSPASNPSNGNFQLWTNIEQYGRDDSVETSRTGRNIRKCILHLNNFAYKTMCSAYNNIYAPRGI